MNPPKGGPMIGPKSAGTVSIDMARTSSDFGTARSRTSRPTGTIIAPPMPWTMRASTSSHRFMDAPQHTEPSVKTRIAARNTVRVPNRSAVQPDSGMKIASDRR